MQLIDAITVQKCCLKIHPDGNKATPQSVQLKAEKRSNQAMNVNLGIHLLHGDGVN